jgi:hypothetical protein
MSKRDVDRIGEEVQKFAERLTEKDEKLAPSQLANELRMAGVDPDALRGRFHKAAKAIAERERLAKRVPPLALQHAIEQTAPADVLPATQVAADKTMEHWLDRFVGGVLPEVDLTVARAYRKSEGLESSDEEELDELADRLKAQVKKEMDEGKK